MSSMQGTRVNLKGKGNGPYVMHGYVFWLPLVMLLLCNASTIDYYKLKAHTRSYSKCYIDFAIISVMSYFEFVNRVTVSVILYLACYC